MKKKMFFRSIMALVLCIAMVCSTLPAYAEGMDDDSDETITVTVTLKENDVVTDSDSAVSESVQNIEIDGVMKECTVVEEKEITVSAEVGDITVTENEGHGEIVSVDSSVAPEEYDGKSEVFDEVYPNAENSANDLFQGGGLGYENQFQFAVNYGYIVEEVDENGVGTGKLVLDASSLIPYAEYGSPSIQGKTPEYVLIASGERGFSKIRVREVEYELDENGEVKLDSEGKPIYRSLGSISQHAAQMVLFGTDGKAYYAYSVASDEEALVTSMITGYEAQELSKSDLYKDDPETQKHIRGIALHGYWGTSNEETETGEYKIGSLSKLQEEMRAAVENGMELSFAGSTNKEDILAAIDALSEGDALTATQAAFWAYSQGKEIDGESNMIITGEFPGDSAGHVSLVYQYLLGVTEEDNHESISVDEDSMNLSVIGKVSDENTGIYNAALNFKLTILPGEKDELKVVLQYTDAEGNLRVIARALGKENNETTIAPNADGSYTLSDLKLSANQNVTFDLQLEGIQKFEDGVYVYSATHTNDGYVSEYFGKKGAAFSTLVGVRDVSKKVNVNTSVTLKLKIEENKNTDTTPVGGEEQPPVENRPTIDSRPTVTIRNERLPMANKVDLTNDTMVILDDEVPLASAPKTGDVSTVLNIALLIAVVGLVVMNLEGKKHQVNG